MKKTNFYLYRNILFLLIVFAGFSCVPVKRVSYVRSDSRTALPVDSAIQITGKPIDNLIRPGDELYIRITSADDEKTSFTSQTQPGGIYDPTLLSYTVSDDGSIKLPYIGKIYLSDLTIEEASDSIESSLSQYLFYPSVFMRFMNTRVTVLGEVNRPGVYMFNYKNINILQALAYAGDISDYGNRRNVLLIREDGVLKSKYYLDVTTDKLFESENYLIKSNDVIYVEPLKRKKWDMRTVPYNLILSVISTAILIFTFVNTN